MSLKVIFEWSFSPPDYFEEQIDISRDIYSMIIADGKVLAEINSEHLNANPSIRSELHNALTSRFLAAQLLTHRSYELSSSSMTHIHPDGHKEYFLNCHDSIHATDSYNVDLQVMDKDGNIISDSKKDLIEKKNAFADLITKHSIDNLLSSLIKSYDAAVHDPNNELVHLYEIREALSQRFCGESAARAVLNVPASQWSRLGQLSNNESLRQGRHRGKAAGMLRDASESELTEARGIARAMIEGYLLHLEAASK